MYAAQSVHDHELGAEEPDAIDIQSGDFLGVLGDGEVDVETSSEHRCGTGCPARPRRGRHRNRVRLPRRHARGHRRHCTFVDFAFGSIHGHQLAVT